MQTIGENIKQARLQKGTTQSELAKAIGTTKAAISRYETGKRSPKYETLKKIANVLGVDWTNLVPEKNQASTVIDHMKEKLGSPTKEDAPRQRSPFRVGESYFGGTMTVTDVTLGPNGNERITFDIDEDALSVEEIEELLSIFKRMSKLGISVNGLSRLAEAAANAINESSNHNNTPPKSPHSLPMSQDTLTDKSPESK